MRNAQIERLQALKKSIRRARQSPDGADAYAISLEVEILVDILLMEREGHDGVVVPAKGRIES